MVGFTEGNYGNYSLILVIVSVILLGAVAWMGWASFTKGEAVDVIASEVAVQVNTPNQLAPASRKVLSASQALATGEPVLFVFVPYEKCSQQYCLTADVVEKKILDSLADAFYIVEVPVHSFYIYTVDTPPEFIIADWDLYPTYPQADWMPAAEMTDFGWGISETRLVLVDENREMVYDAAGQLDIEAFVGVLGDSARADLNRT